MIAALAFVGIVLIATFIALRRIRQASERQERSSPQTYCRTLAELNNLFHDDGSNTRD